MARRSGRPGRTLALFALGVAVLVVLLAVAGAWRPTLDVDLAGGTRVLLQAEDEPTGAQLDEAAAIVGERVGSLDVAGADVFTWGRDGVVVEAPGRLDPRLVPTVQPRGRLGIRAVACSSGVPGPCAQAAAPGAGDGEAAPGADDGEGTSSEEADAPTDVAGALAWSAQPPATWTGRFASTTCEAARDADAPAAEDPLVACDDQGVKYLLTPALVDGSDVDDAEAVPGTGTSRVQLDLDSDGTRTFARLSEALLPGQRQFAVELDGRVVTAPRMQGLVADGNPSFSGTFDQRGAQALADTIDAGALPMSFAPEPSVEGIGPSVPAGTAWWAAVAGLLALCVAGLVRYRRAGLVGAAALVAAGVVTWAALTLLGRGIGLTTGLPAVAAVAVGVGLVAGSFVLLAERIRAELAAGKSAVAALDDAWPTARNRSLAGAAAVLLTALVVAVVGAGAVRSGALILGLVAVVDVVVLLLLVRPMLVALGSVPPAGQGSPRGALPGRPRVWHAVTAGLLVVAVVGLARPGIQLASDLAGGTEIRVVTPGERPDQDLLGAARDEASGHTGVSQAEAYAAGEGLVVRTNRLGDARAESLGQALSELTGAEDATAVDTGPVWRSGHVTRALIAIGAALLLGMVLLRAWTGSARPAVAAAAAVLLDVVLLAGLGSLLGLTVSTATLTGLVALLAWSWHDKALVLDRLAEVTRGLRRSRGSWTEAVSAAAAGMLGRTVGAAAAVLLPALAVLVLDLVGPGVPALAELALLLVLGAVVVAWTSLFVTVPLLVRLRAGEKDFRHEERRAAARRTRPAREPAASTASSRPAVPARPPRQAVRTSGAAKRAQPSRQSRASRGRGKGGRR